MLTRVSIIAVVLSLGAALSLTTARGQDIYVTNFPSGSNGNGSIGEYTTSGAVVNGSLILGLDFPAGLAVSGSNLFVVNNSGNNSIGEYTTSGATVNATLVLGLVGPTAVAISGSDMFVANNEGGTIGEYTTSGSVVNASLVSGLIGPFSIAVSGSDLFVTTLVGKTAGAIGEYTTSGATVNASLVTGLTDPTGLVLSGTDLFVANSTTGIIGEYTTSGATVNPALISGLNEPFGIAVSGSDLFVTSYYYGGMVGEYTTSGATVNASLVSGLTDPQGIAVTNAVPEPSSLVLLFSFLAVALVAYVGRRKISMRRFALAVALLLVVSPLFAQTPPINAVASQARDPYLPDLNLTPGKVTPGWTLEMTKAKGGTQWHRHVTPKLRREVWALYGYDKTIGPYEEHSKEYEIDHLIPNCLGGASEIENLWPEPYKGQWNAHVKDRLEMHVRTKVIHDEITLEQAWRMFTPNWIETYKAEGLPDDKNIKENPSPRPDEEPDAALPWTAGDGRSTAEYCRPWHTSLLRRRHHRRQTECIRQAVFPFRR